MMFIIIFVVNKKGMSDIFMDVFKIRIGGREVMINVVLEEMFVRNFFFFFIKKYYVVVDLVRLEVFFLLIYLREE